MILNKWCKSNIKQLGYQAIVFKKNTIAEPHTHKGVNHLIEHCMCGCIPNMEYILHKNGLEYNAYTTNTEVVFYVSGLNKNVNKISNLYFDNILNYDIPKNIFDREKQIVIQECNQMFTQQTSSHILNVLRMNYNHCSAIGYSKSLEQLTYEQFCDYKKEYFKKPTFRYYISNKRPNIETCNDQSYIKQLSDVKVDRYDTYETENIIEIKHNSHILFHNILNIQNDELYCCLKVLFIILQNGLTSPLLNELRLKRGLIYDISCDINMISDNQGIMMIHTSTDRTNVIKVVGIINKVLNDISKYVKPNKFKYNKQCMSLMLKQMSVLNYNDVAQFNDRVVKYRNYIQNMEYNNFVNICSSYFKNNNMMLHIDGD